MSFKYNAEVVPIANLTNVTKLYRQLTETPKQTKPFQSAHVRDDRT